MMKIKIKKRYFLFLVISIYLYFVTEYGMLINSSVLIELLKICGLLLIPLWFIFGALCLVHIGKLLGPDSIEKENELVATLGAAIMRSDGIVSVKEKNIFYNYIKKIYNDGKREKEIINILNEKLKNPVKIADICIENKEYVTYNRRFSICQTMYKIAAIENGICEHEKKLLEKTMNLLSLSKTDKEHLKAEFGFNHRLKENKESINIDNSKRKNLKIFGLNNTATKDEIKKKYKELCFEHHPDRYENSDEMTKKYHSNKMKQINEAYNILIKNY